MTTPQQGPLAPTATGEPSPLKRFLYFLVFGLVLVGIVMLAVWVLYNDINSRFNSPRKDAVPVATGVTVKPFLSWSAPTIFPMGMTVRAEGGFYLSEFGTGKIQQVATDGAQTQFALPAPAVGALASWQENLFVVAYNVANENATGSLYRYAPTGERSALPPLPTGQDLVLFTQLAVDGSGNLYVSDPLSGKVFRYAAPDYLPSEWWTPPRPSTGATRAEATGIAYDATKDRMIVCDSAAGAIYAVPLQGASQGTQATILARDTGLDARAIAVDAQGHIYLALWKNDASELVWLKDDGSKIIMARNFRSPSAIVVMGKQAYVVNSDAPGLLTGSFLLRPRAKLPFTVDLVDFTDMAQ